MFSKYCTTNLELGTELRPKLLWTPTGPDSGQKNFVLWTHAKGGNKVDKKILGTSIIVNQSLHNRQRHATIMQRLSQFLWFSICSFCFCYSTRLKISSTRPAVISDRNGLNTRVQLLLNLWMFLYCLVEGFHNKNNFLLLPHL